ncbi:hypothetical protein [Bacillus pinisoli]|uniref:hypothetical protein n=1 Tax=Bacillus pinisoli TaxID=2901866 RepID=UPI001FF4FDED|nr:hypothetical protein [Bacillus pinisoli]
MYRENKPLHISPYDHPDIYPGPRPWSSFVFYKGVAHRIEERVCLEESMIHVSTGGERFGSFLPGSSKAVTLAQFLDEEGHTPLHKRIPVLAYGSNVCLAQLLYKANLNHNVSDLYICFRATLLDTDIVYGSFLAPYGALPAIMAPVKGAETEVWVTFLEPEQLEHMNKTEGGYQLRELSNGKIKWTVENQIHTYYAYYCDKALWFKDSFVRFPDIPGNSPLPAIWQADMLVHVKELCQFGGTREEFIHLLRWNHSFRLSVEEVLKTFEVTIDHPDWVPTQHFYTIEEQKT